MPGAVAPAKLLSRCDSDDGTSAVHRAALCDVWPIIEADENPDDYITLDEWKVRRRAPSSG